MNHPSLPSKFQKRWVKKITVPDVTQKQVYLQNIEPDWSVLVTDQRKASRTQWEVTAKLTEGAPGESLPGNFTNQETDYELPSLLMYKRDATSTPEPIELGASVLIYQSEANPPPVINKKIDWQAEQTRFYLDLKAFGYYPQGKYQAAIEFNLEVTP